MSDLTHSYPAQALPQEGIDGHVPAAASQWIFFKMLQAAVALFQQVQLR
jgi:hypothetical protein